MLKELNMRMSKSDKANLFGLLQKLYMAEVKPYDRYITNLLETQYVSTQQGKATLAKLNALFKKAELPEPEVYVLNSCILLTKPSYTRVFGTDVAKLSEDKDGTVYLLTPNSNLDELLAENEAMQNQGASPLKVGKEVKEWLNSTLNANAGDEGQYTSTEVVEVETL